ncbi:hypothetical protein EMIHUDRAFT_70748 [Emiliania huxleyi CCMP1516]|uniref:Sm domain-containing protein n=2 Tax=Emiliania huxleyi TaxID=2903 RepID=A0A0D3KKV7_EMIH1|nr:hypothetical protein EMIHUDRAFT_70748 [Emiliania huxleyi CCMP1516]EOD36392.1 hypothetical protein EMIHUDRAFT_70748 [Emiliania huxleyi CCMP1516]|eukprot:XP_005788821.1 hypothetical protein EMIHUDRAFT_70748 [Emiliania huxleyi CCMP1516]
MPSGAKTPRPWDRSPATDVLPLSLQLFFSFFKTLVGKEVVVELKNGARSSLGRARPADLAIRGTLHSVDQFLNVKLLQVTVDDRENFPHMQSVKTCFIRGSVIKYVQLPASEVDTELLQDATRREMAQQKQN